MRRICPPNSDFLTDALRSRAMQRREHAPEREDGAGLIRDRYDTDLHRLAGRRIRLGDSAQRLRHRIGARKIGVWTPGPVSGNRNVHELRVDLLQIIVAVAVLLRGARAEVLTEDVGARDELVEDLPRLRLFQIERDALHAAIARLEHRARKTGKHAAGARRIAGARHLDLYDLCAEIGHQHVGNSTRLGRRACNDFDAGEGAVRSRHRDDPFHNIEPSVP
jgi:hypothetical protein